MLAWRTHLEKWTGLFKLLSIQGKMCTIDLPHGPIYFRSRAIRPHRTQLITAENENSPVTETNIPSDASLHFSEDIKNTIQRRNPARNRHLS